MASSPDVPFLGGEELIAFVRERIAAGQKVSSVPFCGVSMLPMLRQGKDLVELAPLPERLKKYDLPVYRYPNGKYVMHRVIRVRKEHYVCCGDNLMELERIPPEWMIAVVSAFFREGKRVEVTDRAYLRYCRRRVATRPLRLARSIAGRWVKRVLGL